MIIHIEASPESNNLNMKCKNINVLVVYHSETNHTKKLAEIIGEGVKNSNANVIVRPYTNVTYEQLVQSSAIAIGSPVYYGNPSWQILKFIDDTFTFQAWKERTFEQIPATVFSTGGSFFDGTESTLSSLGRALKAFGMQLITPDITMPYTSSLGVGAVTQTKPYFDLPNGNIDAHFLNAAEALGRKLGLEASAFYNKSCISEFKKK